AIGETTNNVAEYKAAIFALKKARHLLGRENAKETEIEINSDSELMVRQLQGSYKIKDAMLRKCADEVRSLARARGIALDLRHVERSDNREADRLANRAIDERIPMPAAASDQGWLFQTEG
ncbi:MAG: ribonuclease HI family protein, partial [Bacteroidota bacterium]